MMPAIRLTLLVALALTLVTATACTSKFRRVGGQDPDTLLTQRSVYTINLFKRTDPTIARFFDRSLGYVVFPDVTKGGVGLGAAHGKGVVYEGGQVIGFAQLYQGTVGLQLGGQMYSQVVFFQSRAELQRFKSNAFEFAAGASALASTRGAAAQADHAAGVAVFLVAPEGVMLEAALGGQRFTFRPKR